MIPSLTALLSSVAGKAAVGVIVATTSVGAAAAAGAQIPFVPQERPPVEESTGVDDPDVEEDPVTASLAVEQVADEVDEPTESGPADPTHGEIVSAFTQSTELEGCAKGQATAAVARGDVVPGEDGTVAEGELAPFLEKCQRDDVEETKTEETEDAEKPADHHGAVVSTFAHETDLQGCERGQAVAAVARRDVVPGEDGTVNVDDLAPYLEKCRGDEAPDADEIEADETESDSAGPPAHAGKPDKPDKSDRGGRPDHAGPPAGKGPNG